MMPDAPRSKEARFLTVVIATLGHDSLSETIRRLNAGSVVPNEILVCIPAGESHKAVDSPFPNARVVETDVRGQVAQRAVGFRNAAYSHVLQLDDDMLVDEHCIERLFGTLEKHGPKAAVAPALYCLDTGESFYKAPKNKTLLKWYYWLLNGSAGYQPGAVTRAGTNVGIDPVSLAGDVIAVDWLPGGCILHRKQNLILENFYPFRGKAYCEDIIHSYYLANAGVRLFVSTKAVCWLDCRSLSDFPLREFWRNLVFDLKARRFFVRLTARSYWRMAIYYVVSLLRHACLRAFRRPLQPK